MEKYVAREPLAISVLELSDDELLKELERTGNVYGFVRTGEKSMVECYTCSGGGWTPSGGGGRNGPIPGTGPDGV